MQHDPGTSHRLVKAIDVSSSSDEGDTDTTYAPESESVDSRFVGHDGFVTVEEESYEAFSQHHALDDSQSSDELAAESEDWADQELRNLRENISQPKKEGKAHRRRTLDGIDIAPRSSLSPAVSLNSMNTSAMVFNPDKKTKSMGKLTVKLKLRDRESGRVPEQMVRAKGRFRRSRRETRRKSGSNFDDDVDTVDNKKPIVTSGDLSYLVDFAEGKVTNEGMKKMSGSPDELFRYVVNEALDKDEEAVHAYLLTLAYFTDPVRVMSDLITEHDLAEDAVDSDTRKEESSPAAERIMSIVSFWVSHLWYQFEGSEELMTLLERFLEHSLKGKRWRQRLKDTINTLRKSRETVKNVIDHLMGYQKIVPVQADVFGSIDPEEGKKHVFAKRKKKSLRGSSVAVPVAESSSSDEEELAPKEDLASTFVGGETYTIRSRPMGLAALMEEEDAVLTLEEEPKVKSKPKPEAKVETKKQELQIDVKKAKEASQAEPNASTPVTSPKRSEGMTLVGAEQYTISSKPMGLFGLVEDDDDETISSLWDSFKASNTWETDRTGKTASQDMDRLETETPDRVGPADIAKQLTLVEVYFWKLVSPLELQGVLWKSNYEEKGPNVKRVITWHKRIASWVQAEILSRAAANRIKALKSFILICEYLEEIQNFHTLFAVVGGMKVGSVSRLGLRTSLDSKWVKKYDHLLSLASTRDDWAEYRKVKEKATKFPFFPFLGLYMEDLQRLEREEPTFLGINNATVNFRKMRKLGVLLKEIVFIQRGTHYSFPVQPQTLSYVLSYEVPGESELWEMSYAIRKRSDSDPIFHLDNSETGADAQKFLTAALSPRGGQQTPQSRSPTPIPAVSPDSPVMSRARSSSISETFRKWQATKPIRKSDMAEDQGGPEPLLSPERLRKRFSRRGSRPDLLANISCPACSKGFSSQSELIDHLLLPEWCGKILDPSKPLQANTCPVCEESFTSKALLVQHLTSVCSTPTKMLCPVCADTFDFKGSLLEHLKSRVCFHHAAK